MRLICLLAILFSVSSFAGYNGSVSFSSSEKENHRRYARQLSEISKNCLQRHKKEHLDFYYSHCLSNGYCLSKFYGERRYSMQRFQRRGNDFKILEHLPTKVRQAGFPESWAYQMKATSCVGLALQCLEEGFSQTGQSAQWAKVMRFVRANNVGGTSLQHALQQLGWKVFYWNPSSKWELEENARRWDAEEKNWQSKGWHLYRWQTLNRNSMYWYNFVDDFDTLVGFETSTPRYLYNFPYWVGIANTGYHVFPGTFGQVVEAHSTRHFTSIDNLEFSDFNPMATGGGPRWTGSEKYRSGMIAFPPLY